MCCDTFENEAVKYNYLKIAFKTPQVVLNGFLSGIVGDLIDICLIYFLKKKSS